jgi:2-polyprenyl-3-methyl-5-hydroxy-6-metoxy-1,4-benzoquinol methylase
MTSPFEQIAPRYARLWSETARGRAQREHVWREFDTLFRSGGRLLDLGCGTGDDAAHLMSLGVDVLGIDSAANMVQVARTRGVDARHMAIEELGSLEERFDGAISNFGALNCIADLAAVGSDLARLVHPHGTLALCVMSRFCWRNDWGHLLQRWSGQAVWRGIDVYYRSAGAIIRAFASHFEFQRNVSIGRGDHRLLIFTRRPGC